MVRPAVAGTASQAARRERILDAALDLLDDRPYDQVQMRDVADRATVALGTLYRYFPSKELLFAHALLEWSRRAGRGGGVASPAVRGDSDGERLRLVLRRTVRAFERHPNFFHLISVLESAGDADVAAAFVAYREGYVATLGAALVDHDPADASVIATMTAAHVGWLLAGWNRGGRSLRSVYDDVDRAVRIVCPD